jgi:hypothetical protein
MSVAFLMDIHVPGAIVQGLRERGVEVITAQEEGLDGQPDDVLLDRATELRRVVFTQDQDFFTEASMRQRGGQSFSGVFFMSQGCLSYRDCIEELELVAKCSEWHEWAGQINSIPLGT